MLERCLLLPLEETHIVQHCEEGSVQVQEAEYFALTDGYTEQQSIEVTELHCLGSDHQSATNYL